MRRCSIKQNLNQGGGLKNPVRLPIFIEKKILMRSSQSLWDYLFDTIRKGAEFPIALDEALEVMKVISAVKKNTPFDPANGRAGPAAKKR